MTDQTIPVEKIRALLDHWEGFTRDELHHVGAAGVLIELRHLLPDPPLPDPLFLAKATHPEYGEGAVFSHYPDKEGQVRFTYSGEQWGDGSMSHWVSPSTLTFHTPDHPVFLRTEEDYASAPEGTVVAGDDANPVVLIGELWRFADSWTSDHGDMAGIRRRVLRWGWKA